MKTDNKDKPIKMDDRGIFIVGCPRSGTTLLRLILDSHPDLCSAEETGFLIEMDNILLHRWTQIKEFGIEREKVLGKMRAFFLAFHHKYCKTVGKRRWVDKTPQYIFHLDFINELFPDCRVINIIRDGRDVAASHRETWGRKDFFRSINYWPKSIRMAMAARDWLGEDRYLEIRYEYLIGDPRAVLVDVTAFLDIDWDEALLNHASQNHKTARFASYQKPLRPIDNKNTGKWKKKLNWLEKTLVTIGFRRMLRQLGYIKGADNNLAIDLWLERIVQRYALISLSWMDFIEKFRKEESSA